MLLRRIFGPRRNEVTGGWKRLHNEELWNTLSLLSNGYRRIFPWGKAARAWSWLLTSIQCQGQEWWHYTLSPLYIYMSWYLIN
jgi:hypothetical protein